MGHNHNARTRVDLLISSGSSIMPFSQFQKSQLPQRYIIMFPFSSKLRLTLALCVAMLATTLLSTSAFENGNVLSHPAGVLQLDLVSNAGLLSNAEQTTVSSTILLSPSSAMNKETCPPNRRRGLNGKMIRPEPRKHKVRARF